MTVLVSAWRELLLPGVSSLAAVAALSVSLLTTVPGGRVDPRVATPERAAQQFAEAYSARDYAFAARLATGNLRKSLELKARSARRQGSSERGEFRELVIDESVLLARNRLRFRGTLVPEGEPDQSGLPVSITIARHGDTYLAEAIQWPKGPPSDER